MVWVDFQGFLEHNDGLIVDFFVLEGEAFGVVKFSVVGVKSDGFVEVGVGFVVFLEGEVGVSSVVEGSGVVWVPFDCFIVAV